MNRSCSVFITPRRFRSLPPSTFLLCLKIDHDQAASMEKKKQEGYF